MGRVVALDPSAPKEETPAATNPTTARPPSIPPTIAPIFGPGEGSGDDLELGGLGGSAVGASNSHRYMCSC
ncbi:uncharacterized protein FTOL_13768 [Fusarium torulosum]|uniref:Uncharacterized protein n=1 Tax=Fusarium torulosum TaxID=33205 RepID=A0AAE8MMQ1_9HYPO|nr:uncharacterized protein FTOL_13768 [Fusarium torulosum]